MRIAGFVADSDKSRTPKGLGAHDERLQDPAPLLLVAVEALEAPRHDLLAVLVGLRVQGQLMQHLKQPIEAL